MKAETPRGGKSRKCTRLVADEQADWESKRAVASVRQRILHCAEMLRIPDLTSRSREPMNPGAGSHAPISLANY